MRMPGALGFFGCKLLAAATTFALMPTHSGAANLDTSPPIEETDRFLRTPAGISDLLFPIGEGGAWVVFDAVFGVRDGQLMIAKFTSQAIDGSTGYVDETKFAEWLVEDTTKLPGLVIERIGGVDYQVVGFTLGRADDGTAFVDWVHLISPTGASVINVREPPAEGPPSLLLPQCKLREIAECGDLCTGTCVASGSDPCTCSGGAGGCFIDFYTYRCLKLTCPDSCGFFDPDTCGCFS